MFKSNHTKSCTLRFFPLLIFWAEGPKNLKEVGDQQFKSKLHVQIKSVQILKTGFKMQRESVRLSQFCCEIVPFVAKLFHFGAKLFHLLRNCSICCEIVPQLKLGKGAVEDLR